MPTQIDEIGRYSNRRSTKRMKKLRKKERPLEA